MSKFGSILLALGMVVLFAGCSSVQSPLVGKTVLGILDSKVFTYTTEAGAVHPIEFIFCSDGTMFWKTGDKPVVQVVRENAKDSLMIKK
jgi:hypothetical protein